MYIDLYEVHPPLAG